KSEVEPNLARIRETLELGEDVPLVAFSAEKGTGKQELLNLVLGCLAK
ncbi:MAG: YihA family ribosome biogenesis GTP-binding protein, partial [Clostridiales bacterium]|nr:YihA family ribosome biogenesis GTP-binding protein [Clostridiales bacterium]